ncbi:MAG TPA: DinB family protein [Thermoanaerobaculia bacterium]
MAAVPDLRDSILAAWRTNNRVTVFLVENLPSALWGAAVPGAPRRTVRMIAGHIHNARCMWIRMVGKEHGIPVPAGVDRRRVGRSELVSALNRSSRAIHDLLKLAGDSGGSIPIPSTYRWRNLPLDAGHVLAYFVAHEGHHRGQIVLLARQLGHRLPVSTTGGLWQFARRAREAGSAARPGKR